jgi:hypothetical protein
MATQCSTWKKQSPSLQSTSRARTLQSRARTRGWLLTRGVHPVRSAVGKQHAVAHRFVDGIVEHPEEGGGRDLAQRREADCVRSDVARASLLRSLRSRLRRCGVAEGRRAGRGVSVSVASRLGQHRLAHLRDGCRVVHALDDAPAVGMHGRHNLLDRRGRCGKALERRRRRRRHIAL